MNIHEIYIEVKDQAQADKLKDICLKYELKHSDEDDGFWYIGKHNYFEYDKDLQYFAIWDSPLNETKTTEEQFIKLLEE